MTGGMAAIVGGAEGGETDCHGHVLDDLQRVRQPLCPSLSSCPGFSRANVSGLQAKTKRNRRPLRDARPTAKICLSNKQFSWTDVEQQPICH